jgi:replicative DNA helicase
VYEESEIVLDIESLKIRLANSTNSEITQKKNLALIKLISEVDCNDSQNVQDVAMKFFKQQNLKKAITLINTIIQKGDLDSYQECEEIIKSALEAGDNKDDSLNVTDNVEEVLKEDYRHPIPTGIKGLDPIMNGGLAKGELGIILAPLGVGKTTIVTKIASTAKDMGYKVLQIFFEDLPKQIQRKHLACWSGIPINDLGSPENRDAILAINETKKSSGGQLKLKKMSSSTTTIPKIRKYVKKLISSGFKPDMILIDYMDVVQASRLHKDENVGEGATMREFESMLYEMDMVGWAPIQGNRSSISAEYVEADQMGGSIKKAQIGHFILSVAKSLEQKENKTANVAVLKSRFGDDGITFEDVIFDNSTVTIDLSESGGKTFLQAKKHKTVESQNKLNDMLKRLDEDKKGT